MSPIYAVDFERGVEDAWSNIATVAEDVVNGLFYAILAVIAGSAIIAIGGGGIAPMRQQWEKAISRVEQEAPRIRQQRSGARPAGADLAPRPTTRIQEDQP